MDENSRRPDPHNRHATNEAKRTAREGLSPRSQPAEFNDDMRVNRFTPPPPPKSDRSDE